MIRRAAVAPEAAPDSTVGVLCGLGAFSIWGFVVIYFKWLDHIDSMSIVAHRVVWSLPPLGVLILLTGGRARFVALLRNWSLLRLLPISAVLLATNWLLFVYCTNTDRVMQASLAYYIAPLMITGLGVVVLGEKLRRPQMASILLAAAGVGVMIWAAGELQWMPLVIAATWAVYSLTRGTWKIPAVEGLCAELMVLTPFAAGWLLWYGLLPADSPNTPTTDLLLVASSGLVSSIPLLLFSLSAARVRMSTLGIMQYLTPTMQLSLGVLVYGEAFGWRRAIAFGLIWSALGVYTWDSIRRARTSRAVRKSEVLAAERQRAMAQPVH